eukprot:s357_g26.t2
MTSARSSRSGRHHRNHMPPPMSVWPCRSHWLPSRAGGWASKRIFAQSKATTNPTTSRTPVECAAAVLSGPEGGAAACCFMIFAWTGEALRQEIPAGKFQKMDKSFIDIKDFDVDELGPFPKCHEHFGEHLVRNGGADQWAKNSDVPRGGPYPPGHPENPEWLSKSASSSKQAGDRFGQLQAQVQLVLLPALCVMLASKQSLWLFTSEQASGTVTPVLEQQDAYWLPVLGSGALFGLFVVIKFLGHDWLKHAITTVMVWVSAFGVASNIDTVTYLVRNKRGCFVSFAQLEISPANVFGMPAAAALAVAYVSTGHWIVNNILGFSFCLLGIRSINLSSYGAGVVLLSGLFVYDVFWVFFSKPVFGANVMVSVAKGVEAPIKLMLPRDFGGCGDLQFNMLGLGDIAVPGLFAAFLAKWDAVNMAAGSSKSFVYLNCCLLAYMLSLVLTVTVMMIFQHAQPALLYICTCVLLASLAVAHARGELRDLIAFSIPEDAEAEEGIQSASSDADKKESTSSCFSCLQVLQRLKGVSSYFFPAMAAAMAGPTCEKVTVRMMSGDVMEIPALGTLADLRQIIAQSAQTCPEFVRLLRGEDVLDEGIDVGSLANREVSALVTPSVPNLLKALRQHDFNFRGLNERSTSASKVRGLNVLHAAVMTGKLDMIRFTLLEEDFHGTNDTCSDGSGYTALHLAASRGLVDVCLELLACPQVTHQNAHSVKDGTALHVAAQGGHVAVVLALLDSESFTAVNEVVVADQWRQDWRERYGQTALHVAARSGCKDAAKMLLDHPRFTSVLAYTKAFKDAEKMAEEARQTEIALMIRNHPKANSQNGPAVGQGGPPAKFHQFAPGNPYLVTVMPLLVNLGSACAPAHEAAESKHIITQDSWRLVKIEPEVQDIADHFGLDERITGKLQEALNTRPDPGTDLQVMWEILDEARNPPGLTMIKVKEMLEGTFRAGEQKDAGVQSLAEKFKLDERAAYKLSEVLSTKPNKKDVLKALDTHLAASNNPSALVMLKLADLRKDVPLGEVPYGTKGYRDRPYLGNYDRDGRRVGRAEANIGEGPPRDREKGDKGDRSADARAVGSDEDKATRKMAAMKEPAWEGLGTKPGIQVWRIEHFQVVPVDSTNHGQFHKGDSYIVLHSEQAADGKLLHTIFFYIGAESSSDEKGTAAYKTVELDDFLEGEPKQVREEMGKESPAFSALFPDLKYLDGGVDSGFKHVVPEGHDTKLYQVRKVKGKTSVLQVPVRKDMVNDSDSFVLDAADKIYVYDGPSASPFEKQAANRHAEHLESLRGGHAQATHDVDDTFWALMLLLLIGQTVSVVETANVTAIVAIVATAATAVTAVTAATATAIEIVATETGRRSAVSAATGTVIAVSVKLAHMAREVAIDRSGAAEAAVGGGAAAAELQPREVGAKHCHYLQLRSASACLSISFRAVGLHGMGYAMESEGGHPPGMEPASPRKASRCLAELLQSDEGQVHFLIKFLTQRGRSAASEMRNRLANDKPVQARGYHFKKEVIAEAVRCWQENEGQRTPKLSVPKTPASWTGGEGDGKPRLLRRLQVGRKQGTPKQVPVEQCRCLGSPWLWRTAAASTAVAAAAIGKRHRSDAHCAAREAARVDHSLTKEIRDEAGRDRRWDSVSRTTRRAMATGATDVDAVAILALLRSSLNPGRAETLLVQQFRPPVDCPTIELPAGLVDEGETAEEAALRELKEETGYIGTALTREGCMPIAGLHFLAVGLRLGLLQRFFSEPLSAPGKGEGRRVEESKVYVVPFLPFSREPEGEGGATLTRAWLEMAQARRKQTSWTMRRGYAGGGGGGGGAGFNSFSGVQLRASNRGRLDAEPADFDVDFSSSLEVDLGAGLGTGVQRDSFGFTSQPSGVLQGLEQMPFDHQIRAMRWRGDGVCCFILAGSGGIDAFRASRVLPHLLHLSTLSSGHLSQADLSGFRACVLLADLMDWPASEENAPDLVSACKELASNGSAVAVVAVFLSPIPGGPDRDAASTAALQNAVLGAGADCVLFSCPTHPVTCRHLQTAIQGTEAWHERIAEAIESAQAKLARAQEQRWQRHYQIALRKIVWKAPQTVFPHIPQEDGDLQEREDGVGDCSFVRVIGSGAFGSVFLGRHPRLGDVAVKAIKKASIKNIFDLAKVERELSILMGVLDHPNVLQILSCLHSTNNLYIVMEFLGEYTLHTYLQLRQSGSARNVVMLPFQEVQSIFGDMLKAIAHCHAAHVCHRDLKFKNMMIDANSRVTMVDFGLAVQVAPGQELHDSCGTVPFAAPEVMLCSPTKGYDGTVADTWSPDRTADQTSQAHPIKYSTWHGSTSNASSKQSMGGDWSIAVCLVELLCGLGTVESIIGLTADDEANFEHIAQQCLLLCTDYVHQLVLSYAGKDVQGVHRNDLVKTMRGVFRENPKSRMSVRDIGALEAFSAKAGPLPKAKKHRGENDDDERSSWTQSQYSYPKSGGSGEGDETLSDLSVTDWIGAEADQGIRPVQPLLERIGGSQTVVKVVSTVYDWLLPRTCMEKRPAVTQQNLRKMGRIRAGISSFLTELLEDHGKVDLDMLSNVHWNLGVSDFLFTDFADALLEAFRTWGSRGDSAMAEIQASIEKLRLPITAGHRARAFFLDLLQGCVATLRERERERNHKYPQQLTHSDPDSITVTGSVSTARKSEEIVWLMSALGIVAEDFAQALSDLLTQDARLEACLNETEKRDEDTNLATLHLTLWQGTIDAAMEVVFAGEQPLFQQDIGAVTLFCENVRQVLTETGLEDNDAKDMQVLMEHSGELVLNRARNARLVQPPSMAHDVQWFQKTMFDLCKADSYLQFFAECPKMELCLQSIFKLIMNGGTPPAGASFSSKLRSAHQDLYLTDARYSAFLAQVDKVLRAMFPWPVHPAAVANSNIRSLEGFRTEVLCGSTLRSSRLQAVEGMLNAGLDSSKQRVARNARKGRVMAAMQRCAGKLFGAISSDSRVSVFFRNTDPACKDRKAKYLGCAMGGSLPPAVTPSHTTPGATPGTTSPSSASSLPMSPTSSLKQQHQLFRISDYHFDVFLDHVRTALGGEDPEAADLAPAQLENLRQHVVLTSRARACPVSGNTASNGRACPFARRSNDGSAPLLDRVGGSEEIEKILAHMEREAASSSILVPFLQNQDELPCRIAIRNLLATAAAGDKLPEVDPQKLRDKHASLQMLPEHREKWLSCFNKSMVAHILPPEVAEKLQTCFQSLVSSMVGPTEAEQEDDAEEDRIAEERESAVDWGRLQGLMDELEGEKGLSKLIEAWYQRISEDPTINVFFTGTRPQVMMFQTREDSACSTPRSLGPSTQRLRPAPAQGLHTPEKVAATKKRPSSGGHEEATRKCQRADKEPTLSAGHWVSSPRPDDGKASGSVKELKPNLKQQLWPMPGLIETRDQEEQHLLTECYEGPSARSMVRDKQVLPKSRKVAYYVVALGMLILVVVCLRLWAFPAGLQAQMQSPPQQKYAIPPVPNKVGDHNGVEWPPMFVHGSEPMHFFIIGDWGGLDGFIDPPVGGKMVMYEGGNLPGPHVFAHRPSGCTDGQMSLCFNSHGAPGTCIPSCGYNESVDREPQYLVANQMKRRAAKTPPKFILNVGDNFYWGGIPIQCGAQPMAGVHWTTAHMFDTIFRQVYNSPELNNVVWFSVLGNHDYGGWLFTAGWDQQIAFTWHDQRWRLPAQFWKQHVAFPEQGFTIDILLTDSNVEDAVDPAARPTTSLERIYLRQMPSYACDVEEHLRLST